MRLIWVEIRIRIAVGLSVLALLTACSSSKKAAPVPVAVAVQTVKVERHAISEIVDGGGSIFPLHQASLTPKVSSPVKAFYVSRGDRVHRGQLLAVLENKDLAGTAVSAQGSYDQAKATYAKTLQSGLPEQVQMAELAQKNAAAALQAQQKLYDSYLWLYEQHAGARRQVDQAEVALVAARNQDLAAQKQLADLQAGGKSQLANAAKGQVESAQGQFLSAQAQLGYTRLRSPIDGVVADRAVYQGDIAPAGTPLITVMDVSRIFVRLYLPHSQSALLKLGDPGEIHIPGIKDPVAGKIAVISPALDPNSTTVEVWLEAANSKNDLQPGTSVRVDVVSRVVPDALVIPLTAVLTESDESKSVMTVAPDLTVHRQPITIGIETNGMVQVLSGLQLGEEIVSTGAYGLPDNTKVKPQAAPTAASTNTQP